MLMYIWAMYSVLYHTHSKVEQSRFSPEQQFLSGYQ